MVIKRNTREYIKGRTGRPISNRSYLKKRRTSYFCIMKNTLEKRTHNKKNIERTRDSE